MTPQKLSPYPQATIEAVAAILGATEDGLTNDEIGRVLTAIPLKDPWAEAEYTDPAVPAGLAWVTLSKRDRIATAIIYSNVCSMPGTLPPSRTEPRSVP